MQPNYKIFMQRAINLAKNGLHFISNTPIYGYVIVKNNLIIAENWKKMDEYIDNHFIKNISLLKESILYLTLEPYIYYNKIFFIDFILKYKISKAVIGMVNPYNPNIGLGIKLLKLSGIKVIENILKNECYEINKRIFTFYKKKRPFIILKWTQSLNGIICYNNIRKKDNKDLYKQLTDKWRTEEDAFLIDSKSVIYDISLFKYKYWYGKNPIIVILDKKLIIPKNHFIYKNNNDNIIIFTEKKKILYKKNNIIFITLEFNKMLYDNIIYSLYKMNIKSLIIEDNKSILEVFIKNKNWDEAKIFIYDIYLNKGIKSPKITGNIYNNISFFNEKIIFFASKGKNIL